MENDQKKADLEISANRITTVINGEDTFTLIENDKRKMTTCRKEQGKRLKVMLLHATPFGDVLAGQAAAICTNTTNYEKALQHAVGSGHESVMEHVYFTFLITDVSRALLAQLTRHRIASYDVQSQRYVDMGSMPVVIPPSIQNNQKILAKFIVLMNKIRDFYHEATEAGIPKEDARYSTPQAACTKLMLSMNARELRHFFSLRCCNRAQWEIRDLADQMLAICKKEAPKIFADAGPGCVRGHCPEKRPCGKPRAAEITEGTAQK